MSLNSLVVSVPASSWDRPGSSPGEVIRKIKYSFKQTKGSIQTERQPDLQEGLQLDILNRNVTINVNKKVKKNSGNFFFWPPFIILLASFS